MNHPEPETYEYVVEKEINEPIKNELSIVDAQGNLDVNVSYLLQQYELRIKAIEEIKQSYRNAIQEAMEKSGIDKFDNDFITVTYVAPTTRASLDTKRLKAEHPELYGEYLTESEVKASVRIIAKP